MAMIDYRKIEDEFLLACAERGLKVPGRPKFDGTWQRVQVEGDKPSQTSGAYRVFLDGLPAGSIFNHKKGIQDTWVTGQNISNDDLLLLRQDAEKNKNERAQKIKQQQEAVALIAQHVVRNSPPAFDNHGYCRTKQINAHGLLRVTPAIANEQILVGNNFKESKALRDQNPNKVVLTANDLIMPLQDVHGKVWSFQTISAYGFKSYLKYGKKLECFNKIGELENGKPFMIGEGYATMKYLHQVSKITAVPVCDSSNLPVVAAILREHYPDSKIYITNDNDWEQELADTVHHKNPGVIAGQKAAEVSSGYLLTPQFPHGAQKCSDWNDLGVNFGVDEVKNQLRTQLYAIKNQLEQHVKEINHTVQNIDYAKDKTAETNQAQSTPTLPKNRI
ncbi:IncP-type DNA transfer primase TraC [Acinetobacter junii CIP 107470 = MTCC 11364]|uniref:IncP-type DNA transfer primase TraC n=1 Tax=Acinetobacter junii CIP 107470 = MTCC 11364 TaxID=1217666 RepID=S7WUI2_ACIJU|nr:hypothetical protein [Acinetobacter junii]ENV52075.1 hypothetical protein F953_00487 [Acinetobacter junii CIP 107470 = MTCC 11364]EPR86851.1 IncP-type DNA transfer primase TraC [Acinetobacter junii CIP 107470 = MTCC 11364]